MHAKTIRPFQLCHHVLDLDRARKGSSNDQDTDGKNFTILSRGSDLAIIRIPVR
jgi:hypothetical protein